MKKIVPGLVALVMAVGFSAFTAPTKGLTEYSWFDMRQTGHPFITTTTTLSSPVDCNALGNNCVKAYEGVHATEPTNLPVIQAYAIN